MRRKGVGNDSPHSTSNKHKKNFLIEGAEGDDDDKVFVSLSMNSRVHPKGKGGDEGIATRVRVTSEELATDLRNGMPGRYLIPKYRLPQKGWKVNKTSQ